MSIRAIIGIYTDNEEGDCINYVHHHHDSEPSGLGATLLKHYNSEKLAKELIAGGDMSSALEVDDVKITPKYYAKRGEWDTHGNSNHDWDDVKPTELGAGLPLVTKFKARAVECFAEFAYLWTNDEWHFIRLAVFKPMYDTDTDGSEDDDGCDGIGF